MKPTPPRLPHRHRRVRPHPRRRHRARLGGAHRRRTGHRQIHAAAAGGPRTRRRERQDPQSGGTESSTRHSASAPSADAPIPSRAHPECSTSPAKNPPGRPSLRRRGSASKPSDLLVLAETNVERIINQIHKVKPPVVVIDSIQMIYKPDLPAAPGSVTQLRDCCMDLVYLAKASGIAILFVGHVTKAGTLAGPKIIEHIVDTVVYFEGDRFHSHRIVRCVKNRFGSHARSRPVRNDRRRACGSDRPRQPVRRAVRPAAARPAARSSRRRCRAAACCWSKCRR